MHRVAIVNPIYRVFTAPSPEIPKKSPKRSFRASPPRVSKKCRKRHRTLILTCNPPACYKSLSGPLGPKCPGSVLGVSLGPFGPRAPECPKSVPRVSRECQKGVRTLRGHSRDTVGTLFGYSGARGQKGPRDTGPQGPRDSCSRPAGLQILTPFRLVFGSFGTFVTTF